MKKILQYFREVDPELHQAALIYGLEEIVALEPEWYFEKLCRAIVGQQLSTKAAATINGRFLELFGGKLEPELVLEMDENKLRDAGMSWAKIKYVKDLARHVEEELLDMNKLPKLSNEEVTRELVAVKGIGQWTAEMFMMFTLGRPDVFSVGDLGLRRAMEQLYKLENPSEMELVTMAEKWSPFRTYACRVLWKSLDNDPGM